jgi:hypothetical protein
MNHAALFFRAGAFVALLLLIRYAWRTEGARAGGIFVAYLVAFACFREWVVWRVAEGKHDSPPYIPQASMGHVGVVNVVVVAGWVFTAILSFALAKRIQRRNFPGTNIFLTLALTALVTTSIGYAVEVTGIRIGLWRWTNPSPTSWLPFDCPFDMFDAWATTSFITLSMYCAVRYRLFGTTALRRAAVTIVLLVVFWVAVAAQKWLGEGPPHQKVVALYLVLSTILGFVAPQSILGSSRAGLLPHPTAGKPAPSDTTGR